MNPISEKEFVLSDGDGVIIFHICQDCLLTYIFVPVGWTARYHPQVDS